MQIIISKSLLKTIHDFRLNDWHEELAEDKILDKIKQVLIADKIINGSDLIEFNLTERKFQGIYIPSLKLVVHFCQMAKLDGTTRSRNTFLNQNFPISYKFAKENNSSISVSLNPYDIERFIPIPSFIQNSINELLTLDVKINNSLNRLGTFRKYISLNDYLENRKKLRNTNKGNESTLIEFYSIIDSITVYGRMDGANGPNTWITCKVIKKLSNNCNFNFFDVSPIEAKLNKSRIESIKELGFLINNTTDNERELISRINTLTADLESFLKRDQETFKANIIKKYIGIKDWNIHRCMACNYSIEENFICSHIYRYADIVNDYKKHILTSEQAAHLIVSGDNGFLLCPNQDKEFEKGQIYFDLTKKCFVANPTKLNSSNFALVKDKIVSAPFFNVPFTDEFKTNVLVHCQRIGLKH